MRTLGKICNGNTRPEWHFWWCASSKNLPKAGRLKRVQLAWLSNGSLEMVRNSSVPGSLYSKPRNRENARSAQSTATRNPETGNSWTTDKTAFASFYRNDHLFLIFIFFPVPFFSLCSECSVQGVLCKSRTWHLAQEGVDNVMSCSAREDMN